MEENNQNVNVEQQPEQSGQQVEQQPKENKAEKLYTAEDVNNIVSRRLKKALSAMYDIITNSDHERNK